MSGEIKQSFLHRLPFIKFIREQNRKEQEEKNFWENSSKKWETEYHDWCHWKNPEYSEKIKELEDEYLERRGSNPISATIVAEERVRMERFCELAIPIHRERVTLIELYKMGSRFREQDWNGSNPLVLTKYPDGWTLKPSNPDRLKESRNAVVLDEKGNQRIDIFWQDSPSNNREVFHTTLV